MPRHLDAVTDRSIGHARRHHAPPLVTPVEVAAELAAGARPQRTVITEPPRITDQPPALLDEPGTPPPPSRIEQRRERRRSGRTARLLGVMAAMLLLVGATLVGLQLLLGAIDDAGDDDTAAPPSSSATATDPPETPQAEPTPVALGGATDFDPAGNGEENPSDVDNAIDGDPETAWTTVNYYDPLEAQKDGVGLYLDLGEAVSVREVRLTLLSADNDLQIMVAPPDAGEAPGDLDGWTPVGAVEGSEQNVTHTLDEAVSTRYVLVWFTRLPIDDGNYRGGIAEAEVLG